MSVTCRKLQLSHPNLPRHQLVQQRLEQIVEHRPFPTVQVNFAVNSVEDGGDFALFLQARSAPELPVPRPSDLSQQDS